MERVIEYFKTICKIPHCSYEAGGMLYFLNKFGEEKGYTIKKDNAGNILFDKGKPEICFQAHYDMVCVGRAPDIETVMENGWMRAKDSSLGADNGIAIAMMMRLMDIGVEAEFLFTANEEVGLVGAKELELKLQSSKMLNLDSEEEASLYIGCAGGADIVGMWHSDICDGGGKCYEIKVSGLPGGHSGVDIDKNIPSAIKVLAEYLNDNRIEQISLFEGGERRNSIPVAARAIVYTNHNLKSRDYISVKELQEKPGVFKKGKELLSYLKDFRQGVREFNESLGIPNSSINLATVRTDINRNRVEIVCSARAMDAESLENLTVQSVEELEGIACRVTVEDIYPAWKPEITPFALEIEALIEKVFGYCERKAIHAGLECGILSEKFPGMQIASIGPTIHSPHSVNERVNLESVKRTFTLLKMLVHQ